MSSHIDPITCPNCGVNDLTDLCAKTLFNDEYGVRTEIHCDVCGHWDPQGRPDAYEQGETLTHDEMAAKARVLMLDLGCWDEDQIDDVIENRAPRYSELPS